MAYNMFLNIDWELRTRYNSMKETNKDYLFLAFENMDYQYQGRNAIYRYFVDLNWDNKGKPFGL